MINCVNIKHIVDVKLYKVLIIIFNVWEIVKSRRPDVIFFFFFFFFDSVFILYSGVPYGGVVT